MAVIYQKDENAIRFVRDFYKTFKPKHRLTQPEIDSIFAEYDGDYEKMVRDIYGALTSYSPSEKDVTSVINEYALKKKDSENGLLESVTGESEQLGIKENKEYFTAEKGAFVTDLNLNTDEEVRRGLEGAKEGTSATLNFKTKEPRILEGRQSYPVRVYADGGYQGVLRPGEIMKTSPASQIVEIPEEDYFTAQDGAQIPYVSDQQPVYGPGDSAEDVWDYDYILKTFTKNGSPISELEVPENIKEDLRIDIQNSVDLQNREKSRNDQEIQDYLNRPEIKNNKNFLEFYNQEGDGNFYKALQIYNENPNATFNELLEKMEEVQNVEFEGVNIPITKKLSESGTNILSANNPDTNSFMYDIPVSKMDNSIGSLESKDESLTQGLRMGDENQVLHTVDENGLKDYELMLNLDDHILNLNNQRSEITGGKPVYKERKKSKYLKPEAVYEEGVTSKTTLGGFNFNNLNKEQRVNYENLTAQLNAAKNAKGKLNQKIIQNGVNSAKEAFNQSYLGDLSSENSQYNIAFKPTSLLIDENPSLSPSHALNMAIANKSSEAQQNLSEKFTSNYINKQFLREYELNAGKKFVNTEEAVNDPVFMEMWKTQLNKQENKKNELTITISPEGELLEKMIKVNNQIAKKREEKIELEKAREIEAIDEKEYNTKMQKIMEELSTLQNTQSKIREKRGYQQNTQMFDEEGNALTEGMQTSSGELVMAQNLMSREDELLGNLAKAENKGEFITGLYNAKDGLFSKELMYQDTWGNKKFKLPSGKEMTMEEMYSFIHKASGDDLNLIEKAVGNVPGQMFVGNLLERAKDLREKTDEKARDQVGVIGLKQQLRTIDKAIPVFIAKNITARLMGSDKKDVEFMLEMLGNFKNNYYENQTNLLAITNVLEYNVDPGKEWNQTWGATLFGRQVLESAGHQIFKRTKFTEDDLINAYDDIARTYNIPLTEMQSEAGELSLNDLTAQGLGTTAVIMLEMMATMPIAGAGLTKLTKIPTITKAMSAAKKTETGKFWWNFTEQMIQSSIAFEATSGDQATWRMGAAEAGAQTLVEKMFAKTPASRALMTMYKSFGKPGVKVATMGTKIIAGGGAETIAEYSGEFVENLNKMGFDWREALNETVGQSKDDAINKLLVTAILCTGMSSAFTMLTASSIDAQFKVMLDSGQLSPEDQKIIQRARAAMKEQKGSLFGEQLKLWEDEEFDTVVDETPDALKGLNDHGQVEIPPTGPVENPPMPASGGRQLDLFEDESVRSVTGSNTSNNAGNRLFNDPNPETESITKNYINNNSSELGVQHSDATPVTELNEENSKNIADAFDAMENNPNDPRVKESYTALSNETQMQYQSFVEAGYTIEIWNGKGEPYANSDEMIKDVRDNKHLYIFGTEAGFGQDAITDQMREDNPLLQSTNFADVKGQPLLVNDLFRAVHDFFGHTELGNGFGPKGEENAWLNHSRMFSHTARRAMTTETRGQNSWVNFNQNLRREDGSIPKKGDPDYIKPQDRPYAEQKIGLLPDEFVFQQPVSKAPEADVIKDIPFKYNRSEKVYKGTINGREFSIGKIPGGTWVDPFSGTVLGRTKKEAISNLQLAMEGPAAMNLSESSDYKTEHLDNVISLVNAATSAHDTSNLSDTKAPENSESLVDRAVRNIDEELNRIERNRGKNLYMDITAGLGPVAWETFLKALKAGLKAGQTLSVSFNKAIDSIKGMEGVDNINEVILKKKFLFSNDNIMKYATESLKDKSVSKDSFVEGLKAKYPDQFSEIEALELYKLAKATVNPKVVRKNYNRNELRAIDKTQEKINRHAEEMSNDPSLSDPLTMNYSEGGFVRIVDGKVQIQKLPYNFSGAPVLEGLSEQEKINLTASLLIQDFNANKSKIDLKKATGWYSKTKDLIQEKFGSNANIFFELLGVTSPQAPPRINVRKSTEVLKSYSEGKFDEALNIYDSKVKDIMAQHDIGQISSATAKNLIRKASSDPDVLAGIKKSNGKTFGLPVVNSGIVRVLYGNWISLNPANKTGQFHRNLSMRDRSATIDVWAARNMRRVLYSQGGTVPFRRRQYQESTVGAKDFAFAQSVYGVAARELGLKPDDLQAAMWFIEKQIYDDAGWNGLDRTGDAKAQATMTNAIQSMQMTDRIIIGASTYIGNTTPQQKTRLFNTVSEAVRKAKNRNASDEEIAAIISETMQGSVRMKQALQNLDGVVEQLGAMGRPYQTEGLYMNEAEESINLEVLVDQGVDVTPLFDEVIETGMNNEQESVFVSKITTQQDPNARAFRRIEFDESIPHDLAKEMANNIFGKNGVEGLTLNLNQEGDVIGMSFQFVPEYNMKPNGEGLTMENIKDFESNWVEGADKSIEEIKKQYGEDLLNTVENGYINTKVFTNGEYETVKGQEKSFDTDINTELARRQRAINSGDNAQDISDLRTGDEFTSRSVQRFQILLDFADKLDQVYKDLGSNSYADPFMTIPIIRAALKTASVVLRATSSIDKAVNAAMNYIQQAQKDGDKFIQENEIRVLFKDFMSTQEGLFKSGEPDVTGQTEISEEEMSQREELEPVHEASKEQFSQDLERAENKELDTKELTEEQENELVDKLDEALERDHDAAFVAGKDNFFKRLVDWKWWDDKFVRLKELTVEPKYRIKRAIRNIGKDLNLSEKSSNALSQLQLWLTVPGTAKEFIDQANKRIWGNLSSDQIKKVGKLSTMERVIELDNMADAKKVAADELIQQLNSGELTTEQEKSIKENLESMFEDIPDIKVVKISETEGGYRLEYKKEEMPAGIKPFGENKSFPWRMKHPAVDGVMYNKELAEKTINRYKKKWGKDWKVSREATDKLFEEYSNELKRNYENGLISEEVYNELRNVKYNPRRFVDHVIFSERNISQLRKSGQKVKADHIESVMKKLKQGSDQVLFMDPVKLLQNTIAVGAKLRQENDVRRSIYEMISEATKNGFEYINGRGLNVRESLGYILQDGEQVADGYIEMSYSEGGKKIRFAMPLAAYDSLFAHPRDLMSAYDFIKSPYNILRHAGNGLKVFATGPGAPFFFLANVIYDITQQALFTDTYNDLPLYANYIPIVGIVAKFGAATFDWYKVAGDAYRNGELSQEYKSLGGSLEFYTRYGLFDYSSDISIDETLLKERVREIMSNPENKLNEEQARKKAAQEQMTKILGDDAPYVNPNTKNGWGIFKKLISGINSTSEMAGRLANTRRWTIRYINEYKKKNDGQEPTGQDLIDIKKRAVAQAVDYANFNNGGTAIKFLDAMGFAYLNAAAQVFDKSVRYVAKNPIQFTYDLAQYAVVWGAGVMAYNLQFFDILDDEEEEKLQRELDAAISNGDSVAEKNIRKKIHNNRRYYVDYLQDWEMENYTCIFLPGKVTDIVSPSKEEALQEQLKIANAMDVGPERDKRVSEIKAALKNNRITRPRYFKIPSDARLKLGSALVEGLAYKHITGQDFRNDSKNVFAYTPYGKGENKNTYGRILQRALPGAGGNLMDIAASNPLLNVMMKTHMNYDAFYNKPVWPNSMQAAEGATRYFGRQESYQDKWLKDLSRKFDEKGIIEGGFDVSLAKSNLNSLFTNMDRNPINAFVNHTYVGITGGLDDMEKEQYGNQMNAFVDDMLGPVTKRYVGEIDFSRGKRGKSENQVKVDTIREQEENYQVNLRISFRQALKDNGVTKDSQSGQWINRDGEIIRGRPGDNLEDFIGRISSSVVNDTYNQLNKRLNNDPIIDEKMFDQEQFLQRINRMVVREFVLSDVSGDIEQAITDFRRGSKVAAANMIHEIQKSKDIEKADSLYNIFDGYNILGDKEVQYQLIKLKQEESKQIKSSQNQ